jgi:two-component system, OmpR family, phosphate regulon sensor histidine kinase PhoR
MNWWWPRVLAPLLLTGLGGLLGYFLGGSTERASWWVTLGFLLGFGLTVVWDTWRGQRVLRWLQLRSGQRAPISAGLWGEAGYRIQKALAERDRATGEARERLTQFLGAINASPNGVLLIDDSDGITWCNATASDHFAVDPIRDRGLCVTNIVRAPAFNELLRRGDAPEAVRFEDPRGLRNLSVLVRRVDAGMRLVLSQDVTEIERADAMRRTFVANVSHEVRTPLTVLSGALESLQTLDLSPQERGRLMELMRQQTDRMQHLVRDLLTLARIEGSPRPSADRWSRLQGCWAQVRAEAAALSGARHALGFEVDGDLQVAIDEGEFTSLVSNLVSNAVRYTSDGGRIHVAWQRLENGQAQLAVSDTGTGIAAEHIARVTERFFRVDDSRSRESGGTGLGLSIVKHIAQRHGAELLIESVLGKGSTFRVRFPSNRVRRDDDASAVAALSQLAGAERSANDPDVRRERHDPARADG